jgi:EDD domain protein, DegV family
MNDYVILTDSCCDLPAALADEMGISVLPLSVVMGEIQFKNYLDEREMKFTDFYAQVRKGAVPMTSAINTEDFTKFMESCLSKGIDILSISFSSALSSTYQSAAVAVSELESKYPERKMYAIDSLCASMGQGLLVYLASVMKRDGKTIEEVRDFVEDKKNYLCHWFTVDDLNHLHRGGRVSKASAVLGSMLNIKPVLHCDAEGRLINVSKARGRKKSLDELVDRMQATAIDPASQTVFISHGDCIEDAEYTAEQVRTRLGVKDIVINTIGPVVGAHSGPGTIALFFLGSPR